MIAKKYRFHSRGGIKYTYRNGTTIRGAQISLVFAPNSRHHQRFSVVVSKKILKSAVSRNRIRRRVYEAIRLLLPDFKQNLDCIFIINSKDLLDMPFFQLQNLIFELLTRTTTPKT
ncbi:ribonuclease P protein component [Candidatus Saccharibacteria bacterium]|nr:ribonuclease P protein component [Candidatus Saccharibacteria bacterium]